jgi:hypothetical protein
MYVRAILERVVLHQMHRRRYQCWLSGLSLVGAQHIY